VLQPTSARIPSNTCGQHLLVSHWTVRPLPAEDQHDAVSLLCTYPFQLSGHTCICRNMNAVQVHVLWPLLWQVKIITLLRSPPL
jgi:hypothetical protein